MDKASLCAALGMGPVSDLAPRPGALAGEMFKPFVVVLGGMALYLAALYLIIGQNPTAPVSSFLGESAETLAPFAAFLFTLWLFYVTTYVLVGASLSDLWIIAGRLRRLCLSLPGSPFAVCLIAPSSLVFS